jgi:hypothetical protein
MFIQAIYPEKKEKIPIAINVGVFLSSVMLIPYKLQGSNMEHALNAVFRWPASDLNDDTMRP